MLILLVLPWIASLLFAACAPRLARRSRPDVAARVLLACGLALTATAMTSAALVAFVGLARIPFVAQLGHWTGPAPRNQQLVPWWLGILGAAVIMIIALTFLRRAEKFRGAVLAGAAVQRDAGGEIVHVVDDAVYAYACRPVPYRPGVILVSDGLLRTLDPDEQAAVVAHERSHVAHQHALYEAAGLLIATINPLLRPVQRAVSHSLERWADEDAATVTGRPTAARALAHAAVHVAPPTPALALGHARGEVTDRVYALLEAPHTQSGRLMSVAAANTLIATVAVVVAMHNIELLFEILQRHP